MNKHDWVIEVLEDLESYADENGLVVLRSLLVDASAVAKKEIEDVYESMVITSTFLSGSLYTGHPFELFPCPFKVFLVGEQIDLEIRLFASRNPASRCDDF